MSFRDYSEAPSDSVTRQDGPHSEDVVSTVTTDNCIPERFSDFRSFLFGREQQMATLRAAYDRTSRGNSEVVFVSGVSGSGKSSLVESMREHVVTNTDGCFVSRKFDLLQTSMEPYSAIAAAFSDICDLILQSENPMDERRAALVALGPESTILSRVVTNISHTTGEECEDEGYTVGNEDFSRFMVACKHFLGAVATKEHPLFIFFDDLQWADHLSLRLIDALLRRNGDSQHVLYCLAYRDDEADVRDRLHLDLWGTEHLSFSEIELTNLDRGDLFSMLSGLLLRNDDYLDTLATLMHDKTSGNPHAVLQLLDFLLSKDLLYFTPESEIWDWNIDGIEAEVSDNPTEIISKKIHSLDGAVQEFLRLAAFVGHTFEVDVLGYIMDVDTNASDQKMGKPIRSDHDRKSVLECVQVARNSGLVMNIGPGVFKFSHDSIQYFLYQSVDTDLERVTMHLVIGRGLLSMISCAKRSDDERLVLLAASNLTRGARCITQDLERLSTMRLLLRAATLAALKAAVDSAREILECGVGLIQESDWLLNHELCANLQNSYAEANSCTGFFEKSDAAITEVLKQATRLEDRIRAHTTKIMSFSYRHDIDGLLNWAVDVVLRDLGERIPKRPNVSQILVELCRTKLAVQRLQPSDFVSMPSLENPHKLSVMIILSRISQFLVLRNYQQLFLFCALREVRISVKYGVCGVTAASLARYAVILRMMGKVDDAYRWGKASVELCSKVPTSLTARSSSLMGTSLVVFPWRQHLAELEEPLLASYRYGFESTSDFGTACWALSGHTDLRLHLGAQLRDIEEDLKRWCLQMQECHAIQMWRAHTIRLQYVRNLLRESNDLVVLSGEAMEEDNHLEWSRRNGDHLVLCTLYTYRFTWLLSFEEWDGLENAFPDALYTLSKASCYFDVIFVTAQVVMGALALYERGRKAKHRSIARRYMKTLRKWYFDGVPDVQPLWKLVNAEWDAIINKEDTTAAFDLAIEDLHRCRLVVFETMAYQRVFHLTMAQLNMRRARHYLILLIARCREWGNVAKVEWLEYCYSKVLQGIPTSEVEVKMSLDDGS
ncbi:histidine kinase [Fragilaria crotonensis]|nr:histidine kinase [Fragilaria crotonensis]